MNQENNHIDQFFKDRLYDYEAPAPTDMWQKIDDQMKFKRKKMWWTIAGAMAASFALILSAGIGYYIGSNEKKESIAQIETQKQVNETVYNSSKNQNIEPAGNQTHSFKVDATNKVFEKQKSKNNSKHLIQSTKNENLLAYAPDSNSYITTSEKPNDLVQKENTKDKNDSSQYFGNQTSSTSFFALNSITKNTINAGENHEQGLAPVNTEISLVEENENKEVLLAQVEKKQSKINVIVGGSFAPFYSYRDIRNNNTRFSSAYFNQSEKAMYTYSGGLNIQLEKGRLRLESGLYYSNMGQQIENLYVADNVMASVGKSDELSNYLIESEGASMRNSTGNIILNSTGNVTFSRNAENNYEYSNLPLDKNTAVKSVAPQQTTAKQVFHYIELPVLAHYRLFSKFVQVSFSGGLSANFLVGNSLLVDQNGTKEEIGSTSDVKTVNYAGITGFSFEVPVTNRIMFRMEPRLRYYLNSLVESDKISTHPYTFGIYSGISYKF